jgi:hypothetical protein
MPAEQRRYNRRLSTRCPLNKSLRKQLLVADPVP